MKLFEIEKLQAQLTEAHECIDFYADKDNCDTIQDYGKIYYHGDNEMVDVGLKKPIRISGKAARDYNTKHRGK